MLKSVGVAEDKAKLFVGGLISSKVKLMKVLEDTLDAEDNNVSPEQKMSLKAFLLKNLEDEPHKGFAQLKTKTLRLKMFSLHRAKFDEEQELKPKDLNRTFSEDEVDTVAPARS